MSQRTGIMLCHTFDEKRLLKWGKPWLIQPKYDGLRCRARLRSDAVSLVSSQGNDIISLPHVCENLEYLFAVLNDKRVVLDGELYSHDLPFEQIVSRVKRTKNLHEDHEGIQFHLYDFHREDSGGRILPEPNKSRWAELEKAFNAMPPEPKSVLRLADTAEVSTLEDIDEVLQAAMLDGFEGVILRNPLGIYETKRSPNIMKLKPMKQAEFRVLGYELEVSIEGCVKNAIGSLKLENFNVGTGPVLTRENRERLWYQRETLRGRIATIKYQELTVANVPRFPVLLKLEYEHEHKARARVREALS